MGRAWGSITLLVGVPTACLGFVVPPSIELASQRVVSSRYAKHSSGGISSVSCSTALGAFRSRSRRQHSSLVMMAKGGKGKGKGKAGRMDLIER